MANWFRTRYPAMDLAVRCWWLHRLIDVLSCRLLIERWIERSLPGLLSLAVQERGGDHAVHSLSGIDGAGSVLRSVR
jgi:hypothetical protein